MKKKKINIIIAVTDAVLAAAMSAALIYSFGIMKEVNDQPAADMWAGTDSEMPFTAVSVYTDETNSFDLQGIYRLRGEIAQKTEEQITGLSEGYSEDCWYGIKEMTVSGGKGSFPVSAYYTGGDYFNVHTPEVISGSVYNSETMNIDTVVLDDYASWKLFGSLDTAGMKVTIGDSEYLISAVIASPEIKEKNLKKAYDNAGSGNIYLPYQAANTVFGEEQKFTAYETLLPDQITGFASGIVVSALSSSGAVSGVSDSTLKKFSAQGLLFNGSVLLTDSRSDRFSLERIREFSKNMFGDTGVSFELPFYAEAAENVMMRLGVIYKIFFPVFVLLMVSACYWIVQLCSLAALVVKRIYKYFDDKADKKKLEKYYKTHPKIIIKEIDEGESK